MSATSTASVIPSAASINPLVPDEIQHEFDSIVRSFQRDDESAAYFCDPARFAKQILAHHFTRDFAMLHMRMIALMFGQMRQGTHAYGEGSGSSNVRKNISLPLPPPQSPQPNLSFGDFANPVALSTKEVFPNGSPRSPESLPSLPRDRSSQYARPGQLPLLGVQRNGNDTPQACKVAIAAPRNFAKSTLASLLLPMWSICLRQSHFICLISNTHAQAVKFLQAIKHEFESNRALKAQFPALKPNPDKWSEQELELSYGKDRIKVLALGAEAQLRGLKFLQHRPDLIILDDIEDDEMVRSEIRRSNLQWWLDHVVLMTNPHARIILVGTVLHEASLLNRIVMQPDPKDKQLYGNWTAQRFQALEGGKSAWEAFMSTAQLEEERSRDFYGFAQERQNEPVPADYCPFKPEFFRENRFWTKLPDQLKISITLDPACTDKEYSDETAICVAGWDSEGSLWVIDMIHGKYTNPSDIIDLLFQSYKRWAVSNPRINPGHEFYCVGIEKISFQKFLIHLFNQECRRQGMHPYVKELKGDRDKTRRIWQLELLFRESRIFLRPDMNSLEGQLKVFPNGQHDDQADSLAYHLSLGLNIPHPSVQGVPADSQLTMKEYIHLAESDRHLRRRFPDLPRTADVSVMKWMLEWN